MDKDDDEFTLVDEHGNFPRQGGGKIASFDFTPVPERARTWTTRPDAERSADETVKRIDGLTLKVITVRAATTLAKRRSG